MTELVWVECWQTLGAKRTYRLRVSLDYEVCLNAVHQLHQMGELNLKTLNGKKIRDWDEFFEELERFPVQQPTVCYEWNHQSIEVQWFETLIEAGTETIQISLRIVDLATPAYELISLN